MPNRWTALIGTILISGCQGARAEAPTIRIALTTPLTGDYAEYGVNFKRSVEMGIDEINAKGGVLGRRFVLSVGDSKGDPKESTTLAQEWVSDPTVLAQIGDFTSSCCMASQPIYDRAGMIQLSPTASATRFTPGSRWSFSIVGPQVHEQPAMADLARNKLKLKTIAVLFINNDWGLDTQESFKQDFEKLGGKVTATESFFQGDKDFTTVLTRLRRSRPDALFIATRDNDAAMISRQREKMGWNLPVLGPNSLYSTQLTAQGGGSVNGLYTDASFFAKDPDPRIQAYISGFQKRYNAMPNLPAALAYDSIYLLADAIRRAGSLDKNAVRDALAATRNFQGQTGSITFTPERDAIKSYKIVQVVNGVFQLLQ